MDPRGRASQAAGEEPLWDLNVGAASAAREWAFGRPADAALGGRRRSLPGITKRIPPLEAGLKRARFPPFPTRAPPEPPPSARRRDPEKYSVRLPGPLRSFPCESETDHGVRPGRDGRLRLEATARRHANRRAAFVGGPIPGSCPVGIRGPPRPPRGGGRAWRGDGREIENRGFGSSQAPAHRPAAIELCWGS